MNTEFLPVSKKEMTFRGWEAPDFVLVTGDAYVDHHSFGAALIGRVLEAAGYKVAVLAQPYWQDERDMEKLGRPRLGFLVTAGNMDSMVNHYSVSGRRRGKDLYSPGGNMGHRPDRAVTVYSRLLRKVFPGVPVILGGLEASLRRFAHYDYWSDRVLPSVLEDSGADLLIYGMGEAPVVAVADALNQGFSPRDIQWIPGTCWISGGQMPPVEHLVLPGYREVQSSGTAYNEAFRMEYEEQDPVRGKTLVQRQKTITVVQNPPSPPLSREDLDRVYGLPFTRRVHPSYEGQGGIPAIEEVKTSVTACRGCFGSCSFCAITFHQGRTVTGRSEESILQEIRTMAAEPDFKGYVSDIGGPTANFRGPACDRQLTHGSCRNRQCLFPEPCPNLKVDHSEYLEILEKARKIPGVKKVFVRSGIRYDYVLADRKSPFLRDLCRHHVSGRLKVAPEHVSPGVLDLMGKPRPEVYDKFRRAFESVVHAQGLKQFLVPYLISSHPGSTLADAIRLAEYLRDSGTRPEQVQDFYPVPGTLSTAMYHTGMHPLTGETVYVPRSREEKSLQRALLQYYLPENRRLVQKALKRAGRPDLMGSGPRALVPEAGPEKKKQYRRKAAE